MARSVTKWNKAYDKGLIHLLVTSLTRNITDKNVLLETTFTTANLDYCRTHLLRVTRMTANELQAEGHVCFDRKYVIQYLGCARSKQSCLLTALPNQKPFLRTPF